MREGNVIVVPPAERLPLGAINKKLNLVRQGWHPPLQIENLYAWVLEYDGLSWRVVTNEEFLVQIILQQKGCQGLIH
jgi:hypothetical protein